jgi:ABC-2 type transport system ATP-binding protein
MTDGVAIEASGLVKNFGGVQAVDNLSFQVNTGEIFGLVGPDGAGKSTTMRMLAGLLTPDGGTAVIAGHDVVRGGHALHHEISYMPQRFGLYEDLTVDENIRFQADLFGVKSYERRDRADNLLRACGMIEFRRRPAGQLSGGMKQKLGLVCALIHSPKVLLLDEPTSGVDPVSRREFWTMLYGLVGTGVTVLTTTAYLDEADRCHRLALIYRGRLLLCDTPEMLKSRLPGGVVAVVSPTPLAIRDLIGGDAAFADSLVVGNELHLLVDDPELRVPQLRTILDAHAVSYDEILSVPPSIEDLFVSAVKGETH